MLLIIATAIQRRGRGSQAKLAKDVEVSHTTVGKWLRYKNRPDSDLWPHIERALDLEAGALAKAAYAAEEDTTQLLRSDVLKIALEMNHLSDDALARLHELVFQMRSHDELLADFENTTRNS